MQEVVAAYKDPGTDGVKQVQSSGLHIAGERFVVLKADDRSIYGKKVRLPQTGLRQRRTGGSWSGGKAMGGRVGVESWGAWC